MSNESLISIPKTRKRINRAQESWSRMKKNKAAVAGMVIMIILVLVAIFADVIVDYEEQCVKVNLPNRLQAPSSTHLLGTDAMGRDMLARLVYATRITLFIAFSSVVISMVIGTILGSVAGYFGGRVDDIIMRFVDIFFSIPSLLMAICIASALGQSLPNMILAIGIAAFPAFARIVRATILTVREQEFVEAGRALGGSHKQIILFHILPNCVAPITVQATLRLAGAIIYTSSLSFLGLGIKAPTPEWGNMLSGGRDFLRTAQHITLFPGLAIMICVLAVNLMGDGLRDAIDPKMKR